MQDLLNAVQQIKQTIQSHKTDLANNEALTRYALVDVLLNALSWNVHDPNKVFPEYNKGMNNGRADYALLNSSKNPVAVIEAKKLEHLTLQDLFQVTNYAFHSGVKYSIATDGNIWIVADAFKQVPSNQKEIMRLSIETEPENMLLVKLVTLLPANLCAKDETFFPTVQSVSINVPADTSINVSSSQKPSRKQQKPVSVDNSTTGQSWEPFSKIGTINQLPVTIKYPDGTTAKASTYNGILRAIADWLIRAGKLPQIPVKDFSGKTRYLINREPAHTDGSKFAGKAALSNGLWLETNYSSSNSVKNALWLLQQAGENPDSYYFQ